MEKRLKTHPSQWAIFLDFAEKNPQILTKKFDGVNGRKKYLELWEEITEVLNSMGYLNKSVDKWQKAVADWKSKVKAKAADLNRGVRQTGGGGPLPQLNENEMRLINILGRSFITGVQTNKELGLDQEMNIPQSQVTPALVECRISPPPLLYNIDRNSTPESIIERAVSSAKQEKESTPKKRPWGCSSTLEQSRPSTSKENNKEAFTPERVDNQESTPKKGKWGCTSATKTQKIPSTNLADMHKETLLVLNQINSSIEKMADSQERIAKSQERIANALELLVNRNI